MRIRSLAASAIAALITAGVPSAATAQTLDTVRIASAMEWPLFVTHAPGEPYFIYIVLKRGRIVRHDLRDNTQSTFIDLDALVVNPTSVSDERGLLGLAFHPDYANSGYFFVYYTSNASTEVAARYRRLAPGVGDPASASIILNMPDPFTNHNGGWMSFVPGASNGYLYIATGDGGSANDPNQNGQNTNSLLGKMLRIDVDGVDNIIANDDDDGVVGNAGPQYTSPPSNPFVGIAGADEIWSWGLRNPWRNSFDRSTGALYIADVGQGAWEEVNFQPTASIGGENYGWRCYEGNAVTGLCGVLPAPVVFPFHVYSHAIGFSVTGGYVYRGCSIGAIAGHYFYADYGTARVWTRSGAGGIIPPTGAEVDRTADLSPPIGGGAISALASFGEDAFGEMYIIRHSTASGEVFRIVPQGNPDQDCDNNNVADCGEIILGLATDCNSNITIDSCEIAANPSLDCNGNAAIDSCEIAANPALDCNSNATLDSCEIAANPALDCDNNAAIDSCEIAANPALDCNSSGRLDVCELCPGDADNDGDRDFADLTAVLANFGNNYGACLVGLGDSDKNGVVSFGDATATLGTFAMPCP
jgi:hypothetical protein